MEFPEGLLYTKEHEWVKVENEHATVGITEYAQEELGDIVFVELPEPGTKLSRNQTFGVVESVKTASDLFSPLSGSVREANHNLEERPELVNQSPYDQGWIIKISIKDTNEFKELLSAKEYSDYIEAK